MRGAGSSLVYTKICRGPCLDQAALRLPAAPLLRPSIVPPVDWGAIHRNHQHPLEWGRTLRVVNVHPVGTDAWRFSAASETPLYPPWPQSCLLLGKLSSNLSIIMKRDRSDPRVAELSTPKKTQNMLEKYVEHISKKNMLGIGSNIF